MGDESKRVHFIEHRGRRILVVDFSLATPDEFFETMERAEAVIANEPVESLLTLTNVDRARHDRKVSDRLKTYVEHNKPFVKAGAVVGLNEIRKIVFNLLNKASGRSLKAFDDIGVAKDWLASRWPGSVC